MIFDGGKNLLKKWAQTGFDFSFEDIRTQNITLEDGITALLYIFPDADKAPLAKYGIVVFEKNKKSVYVTIERDDYTPGTWFLCTQSKDNHGNMGEVPNCNSPEDFKAIVEKKLGHTKRKGLLSFFK